MALLVECRHTSHAMADGSWNVSRHKRPPSPTRGAAVNIKSMAPRHGKSDCGLRILHSPGDDSLVFKPRCKQRDRRFPLYSGVANGTASFLPGGTYGVTARPPATNTLLPVVQPPCASHCCKENKPHSSQSSRFTSTKRNHCRLRLALHLAVRHTDTVTNFACTPLAATPVTAGCAFRRDGTVTITDNGQPSRPPAVPGQ